MTTFVQIHTLQTFPACNLNRGDDGRPKTLVYGGVERIRYSSQALKYALRNSPVLRTTLGNVFGKRTKWLGRAVQEHLLKRNVPPDKAAEVGAHVTEVCGKVDEKDPSRLKTTTLYFIGPDEETISLPRTISQTKVVVLATLIRNSSAPASSTPM
jgi:CRISPR system Cascade subunit CasC